MPQSVTGTGIKEFGLVSSQELYSMSSHILVIQQDVLLILN